MTSLELAVADEELVATGVRPRRDGRLVSRRESLTAQEDRVALRAVQGLTNREIGLRLSLAEKTVKNYVSGLLSKLGLQRRTQAAVLHLETRGLDPHS